MPVKRTEILPPEDSVIEAEKYTFPEISPPESPEDMALENILADLGGEGADASVHVYRVVPGKPNAFVGQFGPLEFSMEHLQANFGPGDYKIHVRQNGRLRANRMIAIASPRNPAQIQAQPAQQQNNDLLSTMRDGFAQMGMMMQKTIETMVMMQPKPKTTREMLEEMALMKSVFSDNAPKNDPMQVIELASNLAEKITPRTGEVGNGEILLEAIKSFGPLLAAGAASQNNAPATMPGFIPPTIANNPAPVIAPATKPENDPMFMMKMYLNVLLSHAENEHDPAIYADVVLDTVGEEKAITFLSGENWLEKLAELNPRVKEPNITAWLYELRRHVIDLTSPENPGIDGDIVMPNQPSNATDQP